jgi:hypothetical protein
LILALAFAVMLSIPSTAQARTFSTCELARAGVQLNKKRVKIEGIWREPFPHAEIFEELVDPMCPDIQIRVVFAPAAVGQAPPADYVLDSKSAQRAQLVAEKALLNNRDLEVTISGILFVQSKDEYVGVRPLNKDVSIAPPHKWYPFVLLVESIPTVRERKGH